jgi:RNA polymerase sigma-70 factor (ECF subfamily)
MEDADAAAVRLARAGDSSAFRALVERHSRPVFRLAYRVTGNQQDAEDVVQETFLRAWRQLGRFESRSSFATWLHRITVNCALDHVRQRPRNAQLAYGDPGPEGETASLGARADGVASPDRLAFSAEVRQRVASALGELSPAERTAFVLRHFEGHSIEEIGRTLGLRTSATKHSIFRAVQKMRRALEPVTGWAASVD